jgi:UDP-glucose 4-epimerase
MRALVTGCAGFIGSHLTESLLGDDWQVVGVDCFNDNYGRRQKLRNIERAREWDNFDFVPVDLARGDLHEFVADCDTVFHLAAEPGVRSSWGSRFETYVRNNLIATQHLLEAARAAPETRFVYASSSSIYGDAETLPTPEDAVPRPLSPYGATKLAGEHMCELYHKNFGVGTVSLRYFSVYGPRQRPDMAFNIFCHHAIAGRPLTVFGDGQQTRDFTYVADVVTATRRAAEVADIEGEVFNVGGGGQISLNRAIDLIGQLAGRPLTVNRTGSEHGDVRDTGADVRRMRARLDYEPQMPFEEGLRAEFAWAVEEAGAVEQTSQPRAV